MTNKVQAPAPLVVGAHDGPRRVIGMRLLQHAIALFAVFLPFRKRGDIHGGKLPDGARIVAPVVETLQLHLPADIEIEFEEVDAVLEDELFHLRRLLQKLLVLFRRAKAHNRLDTGAVVPGAVEQHEFASGRELRNVALEVPLPSLTVRRLGQRHDTRQARVHVSRCRRDRAALAGGVAPFEQRHHPLAGRLQPELHLDKLDLQRLQLVEILLFLDLLLVGIVAGGQRLIVDPAWQHGIVDIEYALGATDIQLHRTAFRFFPHRPGSSAVYTLLILPQDHGKKLRRQIGPFIQWFQPLCPLPLLPATFIIVSYLLLWIQPNTSVMNRR
ncbi:hypothetical protein RHSP_70511 [Rhizobium freirei PRF 81]|uniref:Uncharacterized protein n=1 Tax=Rhizobium freirei PRF 81 TaxID=363754 RepID=N6UYR5_9HYPH|nr:hypothetical protein RHSP_70511 [Rhizobium freirei PRF 81]